ncbi:sacsin N-terminal ATP-binding-like domain-containing protein [Tenacibaculum aiptasiae]|uniref:sacsin N-terminal ATP-binding-like domain-containing protein n=1 Tax=Tenacibaculum aiptasiae TaxID=426481 RepID=UPI00233053DF|nr:RNA-binding domain-containing protein [Tenacibaculum aiptasiae]
MSLKNDIEGIFKKNTGYAEPEHAINQAESLKSLSVDLYTDSKRFIYELLQNADDSAFINKTVNVGIRLFGDLLVIAHTGKPFDKRDLRGICGVSDGTKKNSIEKTGYKGIGFKAVFGQSNKVTIYTDKEYFRFDSQYNFSWNTNWGENQQKWEADNERTFSYPWQIIPIYTPLDEINQEVKLFLNNGSWNVATIISLSENKVDIKKAIQELSSNINMFLFLKNIEEIDFNVGYTNIITLNRDYENDLVEIKKNGNTKATWLTKSIILEVPDHIKSELKEERNIPEKLLKSNNTELTFAANIGEYGIKKLGVNESLLYSYLPTEEKKYNIPVLINGSFVISANRETLHENSKWNQWLFKSIPYQLLKWVAELVVGKHKYAAYQLIPSKSTIQNSLSHSYNQGINNAFESIPFILSNQEELLKINQAIIDSTSISKESFITEIIIRNFVIDKYNRKTINKNPFLPFGIVEKKFKDIGVSSFEWGDVPMLLESKDFLKKHSSSINIQVIQYFKLLCENDELKNVTEDIIKNWSFILDHKGNLQRPNSIYFPTQDDENWNSLESEISFLHKDIQDFLLENTEIRLWLEELGVIEKTDLSYLRKTIIENASTYITHENSIETILNIFSLYAKMEIGKDELNELSQLKLLTEQGNLLPANSCYLSDSYNPRLKLQTSITDDIFVSQEYIKNISEKEEMKRFFKMMGVNESITVTSYDKKSSFSLMNNYQINEGYFNEDDKYFKPHITTFHADYYSGLTTLIFIKKTFNYSFSKVFWNDIISNIDLSTFNSSAVAYWGRQGHLGRTSGDNVENYIKWYIKNNKCIPTSMKKCHKANDVFINSDHIVKISGSYLPVFHGKELPQNWKAFFSFKTNLDLPDYLDLLSKVSLDLNKENKIKKSNLDRIQSIYKILLDLSINWNEDEISQVKIWVNSGSLLNTKQKFVPSNTLKYFLDGNESIFQDQFPFLDLNAENKKHSNLENFLSYFEIKILRLNDFELTSKQNQKSTDLTNRLKEILPFFKTWIKCETISENVVEPLGSLENKIDSLNIYEAEELYINYNDINFTKSVNVHFNEFNLYVTNPWNSNSVLLKLPEILCRYFNLIGYDKKLDFLLRSTNKDIKNYFIQESIEIPQEVLETAETDVEIHNTLPSVLSESSVEVTQDKISPDFYHIPKSEYDKLNYAKAIIKRAVINVIEYLKTHSEYDCSNHYEIAESIVGGITKNGNEITVVARPSDEDFILLYYTSEFDVLEYVDAELWCEDGFSPPKQITLGQLLKKTGINRIPVKNINASEIETFLNIPKNDELEFDAVPFVPQKIAKIVSSFANTNGGSLIFGLKEASLTTNEVVGVSNDFNTVEITKIAISMLSPIPTVTYDWVQVDGKSIFVIKTNKADNDILFDNQKYIRNGVSTETEENTPLNKKTLVNQNFTKTVAIIIGIENYAIKEEHQISPVKFAENDALKFKKMLIERMNVDERDIHMLLNEKALKNTLEYDLSRLFHYLTEEDRLIFYFVGHGFHNGITNYLSTYDMHKHHISETAISLNKLLLDPLRNSKCKTAHIFIDACAKSFKNENERNEISNINDEELIVLTNKFPYYATFLSCQTGQSSYSCDILKNGIWTHHLVEAINGNVPEVIHSDKYITDRLLTDYLSDSVSNYTKKELGYNQNPKAILDSSSENVIVEVNL